MTYCSQPSTIIRKTATAIWNQIMWHTNTMTTRLPVFVTKVINKWKHEYTSQNDASVCGGVANVTLLCDTVKLILMFFNAVHGNVTRRQCRVAAAGDAVVHSHSNNFLIGWRPAQMQQFTWHVPLASCKTWLELTTLPMIDWLSRV